MSGREKIASDRGATLASVLARRRQQSVAHPAELLAKLRRSRRGRAPVFLKGAARARAEARSAAGIYLFSDRGAPEGNDRALRYLQISAEEVRANPDRLRGFNLIGGRGLEDTAALVELLREFATDGAEPYREAARRCSIRRPASDHS